jgi:hypothetical protein
MSNQIVGYVCIYCSKAYKVSVCPECNEYKSMIPITKNILAMFEDPEVL